LVNQKTKNLVNAIILSLDGVIALKKTYMEDKMFCCFIDNLIENTIYSKLLELKCINLFDFTNSIDLNSILNKIKITDIKEDKKEIIEDKKENLLNLNEKYYKSTSIIKENKTNKDDKEKIEKIEKEFQISTELKDFKNKENNEETDYDTDCFDQEEEQLEDL